MILAHIFFLVHDLLCVSCQPYSDVQYSIEMVLDGLGGPESGIEMVLDGLGGPESAAFPNRAKTNWQFAEEEQSTWLLALEEGKRQKRRQRSSLLFGGQN